MPCRRALTSLLAAAAGLFAMAAGLPPVPAAGREGKKPSPPAAAAAVEGTVTYTGPLPRPVPVLEANTVRRPVEVDPSCVSRLRRPGTTISLA